MAVSKTEQREFQNANLHVLLSNLSAAGSYVLLLICFLLEWKKPPELCISLSHFMGFSSRVCNYHLKLFNTERRSINVPLDGTIWILIQI